MRRMLIGLAVVMALGLTVASALATPNVTSAVINARIFNDCPTSILTTGNNYPGRSTSRMRSTAQTVTPTSTTGISRRMV